MQLRAAGIVTDIIPITDPGQLGAGATVGRHVVQAGGTDPGNFASPDNHGRVGPNAEHQQGPAQSHGYVADGGTDVLTVAPMQIGQETPGLWTGLEEAGAPAGPNTPAQHTTPARLRPKWWQMWLPTKGAPTPADSPTAAPSGTGNRFADVDERLVDGAGEQITPLPLASSPEVTRLGTFDPLAFAPTSTPADTRSGDPHQEGRRQSWTRWTFWRPFDKVMTEQFNGHRAMLASPGVSTPIQTTTEAPGKEPASGLNPWDIQQSNFRVTPSPWDADLTNDGGMSPMADDGLRLRAS